MQKPIRNSLLDKLWYRNLIVSVPTLFIFSAQLIHNPGVRFLTVITLLGVLIFSIICLDYHDKTVKEEDEEYDLFLSKLNAPERKKHFEEFYDNQ